ncbi:MAG: DNA methyltransferase [Candidatus Woesearchaeota archaeon]
MKDYVFVLGRDPELSFLELISYFKVNNINYELKKCNDEIAVFSLDKFDYSKAISRLGGIIKIGLVVSEENFDDINVYDGTKNKLNYCIGVYGKSKLFEKFEDYLKKWFKENKIKANRKKKEKLSFDPRDMNKNILEFILFDNCVSKTVAVSNPSEYKKRDDERPYNDFVKSISIRLAKILINLSQAKENSILLDPFCGMGIILQEALLMNINVFGVELEKDTSKSALKNIKFTVDKYKINKRFKIYNNDVVNINKIFKKNSIDCVVSEPFLGPYLKKIPTREEALKIISNLNELYSKFFNSLKDVLKKNGKVAIIFPMFKTKSGRVKIDFDELFRKTGFKIVKLCDNIKLPIMYKKDKSIIDREIYVLERDY